MQKTTQNRDDSSGRARTWLTGLGTAYPAHLLTPEWLEDVADRFHDVKKSEGLQQLLNVVIPRTGIETRAGVCDHGTNGFGTNKDPPKIAELDDFFRIEGVKLAVEACKAALSVSCIAVDQITHTVAVTCTNQGSPGYDLLVHQQLGLSARVNRTLLHGVGCAGGLSIIRAGSQVVLAATACGKPARVLGFACELSTPLLRRELADAAKSSARDVSIASALFSDGAAAFVMTNDLGLGDSKPLFEVLACESALLPETLGHMGCYADSHGYRTILTRDVPRSVNLSVEPMFTSLLSECSDLGLPSKSNDFDWALHPGGRAIIDSIQATMNLDDDRLRATNDIYRTRGNSSSPTVLVVLDKLRTMGPRDHIVAASFGPGLSIEMALLKHYR
ncbi:hypothetical protein B0A48_05703 [Cryoendolithus antarcticus]|uniref:Chalcone synthase n=1 Tax=Cryoendolithus antarcticus TaxID=1507870 RepID=A0A1V8TBN8_9PEZI|nr:hypothetical protein B0A48_05703 [Cryoendolithus antarcticus]